MARTPLRRIGSVAVDSGMLLLGDPANYLQGDPPPTLRGGWKQIVNRIFAEETRIARETGQSPAALGVPFANNREGAGVVLTNFGGDGVYPVYASTDERGMITELRIVFDEQEAPTLRRRR